MGPNILNLHGGCLTNVDVTSATCYGDKDSTYFLYYKNIMNKNEYGHRKIF